MTEEILNLIKKDYEKRKESKKEIFAILNRLNELNKHPILMEYSSLLEKLDSINYISILNMSNDDMLSLSFRSQMNNIEDTNGIFICLGSYMRNINGKSLDQCTANHCKKYIDIESKKCIDVPMDLCDEFEATHLIVNVQEKDPFEALYEVQRDFIGYATNVGQEIACQKVLNKKY